MEAITLSDLWPIIVAILGPMFLFAAASMRYQHLDSTKIRELVHKSSQENRELIEQSRRKNRELIEQSIRENRELVEQARRENRELVEQSRRENRELVEQANRENRELVRASHAELISSLGDVRERLARMEGYLTISPSQGTGNDGGAAEAA